MNEEETVIFKKQHKKDRDRQKQDNRQKSYRWTD